MTKNVLSIGLRSSRQKKIARNIMSTFKTIVHIRRHNLSVNILFQNYNLLSFILYGIHTFPKKRRKQTTPKQDILAVKTKTCLYILLSSNQCVGSKSVY